jgi:hypothetical protein
MSRTTPLSVRSLESPGTSPSAIHSLYGHEGAPSPRVTRAAETGRILAVPDEEAPAVTRAGIVPPTPVTETEPACKPGETARKRIEGMRWNLLWYVPLVLLAVILTLDNLFSAFVFGKLLVKCWSWMLLVSPSAHLWLYTTLGTLFVPLYGVVGIPKLFTRDSRAQVSPYLSALVGVGLTFARV